MIDPTYFPVTCGEIIEATFRVLNRSHLGGRDGFHSTFSPTDLCRAVYDYLREQRDIRLGGEEEVRKAVDLLVGVFEEDLLASGLVALWSGEGVGKDGLARLYLTSGVGSGGTNLYFLREALRYLVQAQVDRSVVSAEAWDSLSKVSLVQGEDRKRLKHIVAQYVDSYTPGDWQPAYLPMRPGEQVQWAAWQVLQILLLIQETRFWEVGRFWKVAKTLLRNHAVFVHARELTWSQKVQEIIGGTPGIRAWIRVWYWIGGLGARIFKEEIQRRLQLVDVILAFNQETEGLLSYCVDSDWLNSLVPTTVDQVLEWARERRGG